MAICYIGLGSNLEDPRQQVSDALKELQEISNTELLSHSLLYRSDPVGPPGQPDYINAVAKINTSLEPEELLDALQAIEQAHQRVRIEHWGPRTLDLDLLLYANDEIDTERLKVPHPFMTERSFVLYPLAEIEPNLVLPKGDHLSDILVQCPMGTLEPIA
ncbi:2-amino-4-hydroxy-6-hydroxymethyldihydropteridine diphosphokinase [Marinobacterium sp. LSUCC0821]|jgi:2-amino-4-hydroxy-6-hydroxymethyldihydropteridine diphosphokinase|uniref:2-amino-4-hydroxy-6- hydroxymethyldihydropteridine diphosphokinase n=1 Tax=Marinobacterium sp. LSUCC0821 TaxID=2668067 RepID=UPI0014521A57|nr:2-amino-4-hydroxy-6-hydroxymethyldihydropteridine diphosphokinase [Marinobacterium sp. LSUCC0821]QJD71588.1 2-amino-4-hydroxy-6-hydroxymethyldihydropteridine diphosphokinase [Marinobacterium sp. LSUCC0821]